MTAVSWSEALATVGDRRSRAHHDQEQRGGQRQRADAGAPDVNLPAVVTHPLRHHRKPVARGPQRRQRAQPGHPLVQALEFGGALGAFGHVGLALGAAGLARRVAERHQLVHGEVGHACASSPSQVRSLACARDSCDFEKLGVLSIIPAISSWV